MGKSDPPAATGKPKSRRTRGVGIWSSTRRLAGSTPLPNLKHERFAEAVACGRSVTQVYRSLYDVANDDVASAVGSRLLGNAKVAERVTYLSQQMAKTALSAAAVTAERALTECARVGFANMGDYLTIGEDGLPRLEWRNLNRDQLAALAEVTVDTIKAKGGKKGKDAPPPVTRVKFRLHPKMPAIEFMGKYLKMLSEQVRVIDEGAEHRRSVGVKVLMALLERKARGTLDPGMEILLNELTGFVPTTIEGKAGGAVVIDDQ
jgi:phage terminase small subunit